MDSYLFQRVLVLGFELVSPCPFPTTITITPRAPFQLIIIIIIIIIITILLVSFSHYDSKWSFTGVRVTASLIGSPGLFSLFWQISTICSLLRLLYFSTYLSFYFCLIIVVVVVVVLLNYFRGGVSSWCNG